MSSPVRWKDEGSEAAPELREIMQRAQRELPDEAQIEALTAKVLAQLPAANGVESGTTLKAGTLGAGAKLLAVATLSALAASLWWALPERAPVTRSADRPAASSTLPRRSTQNATKSSEPEVLPLAQVDDRADVPAGRALRSARTRASRPRARDTSGNELTLLHAARVAHRRAPREALDMLRQHERDFPESAFGEEREALMIELLQYFDAEQAARRLSDFERAYPHSPYRVELQRGP